MMKFLWICSISMLIIFISTCRNSEFNEVEIIDRDLLSLLKSKSPTDNLDYFILPVSSDLNNIPYDQKNPISASKVALGAFLFHETALSTKSMHPDFVQTYSCATCHYSRSGFQSSNIQGIGDGGIGFGVKGELRIVKSGINQPDALPIKTLSLLNSAFQKNALWNGSLGFSGSNQNTEQLWKKESLAFYNNLGYEGIETKTIAGFEMHRMDFNEDILKMGAYKKLFNEAFSSQPEEIRYTKLNAALAIAAYIRTLTASEAPFQKYLKGEMTAMQEKQKRGAILFFGKGKCATCHTGPALNSENYYALGMNDMSDNKEITFNSKGNIKEYMGRGGFTEKKDDMYKFKVPQLYNLADSPYYGHGSGFRSIKEIVHYKNMAKPQNNKVPIEYIEPNFKRLNLTESEIDDISEFIIKALFDPNLRRFEPQKLPSGLCFPNADLQSRRDMDCF